MIPAFRPSICCRVAPYCHAPPNAFPHAGADCRGLLLSITARPHGTFPALVFCVQAMITEGSLPIVFRPNQASRIGLVPHGAASQDQIQWFELPRCALCCTGVQVQEISKSGPGSDPVV